MSDKLKIQHYENGFYDQYIISDKDGNKAVVQARSQPFADEIVKRCNAYPELVGILKILITIVTTQKYDFVIKAEALLTELDAI